MGTSCARCTAPRARRVGGMSKACAGRAPWAIAASYETPAPRAEPMQARDQAVLAKVARIAAMN
jgi:hypothetical protein